MRRLPAYIRSLSFNVFMFSGLALGVAEYSKSFAATTPKNTYDKSLLKSFPDVRRGKDGRLEFGDYTISKKALARGVLYALWPNGILAYSFEPGLALWKQQAFLNACSRWETNTPLKCTAWTGAGPYFTVRERTGTECGQEKLNSVYAVSCANGLGPPSKEPRYLSVHPASWNDTIILQHEIGHIIGLAHEHDREDRYSFLVYNEDNVRFEDADGPHDNSDQFMIYPGSISYSEYDYFSIMHYRNCAFTRLGSCNDGGDFSTQAIAPRQCDKHAIGYPNNPNGAGITALDRQSVEKAYMPRLMPLFVQSRSGRCGAQTYSPEQIDISCGSSCSDASPIQWTRIAKGYAQEWCEGSFAAKMPDGPQVCAVYKQDFYRVRENETRWVGKCASGAIHAATLHEQWIECGCRSQILASMCVDGTNLDVSKIAMLLTSRYWRDRSAAKLISLVKDLEARHAIDPNAETILFNMMRRQYLRPYFGRRAGLLVRTISRQSGGGSRGHPQLSSSDALNLIKSARLESR